MTKGKGNERALAGTQVARQKPTLGRVLLLCCLLHAATTAAGEIDAETEPIRIMPLGDSITEARDGQASYRYWLWQELRERGFEVDFVGSRSGVYRGKPRFENFDADHEGHWGWHADEILARLPEWTRQARPDIVLIHLGTNDLGSGEHPAKTLDELCKTIKTLQKENPDIAVLIAKIIPATGLDLDALESLNAAIGALAYRRSAGGGKVLAVDQAVGFDPATDTYDGVHPNETGEKKMATRWLAALEDLLQTATAAP